MTEGELQAIEAAVQAAVPGPWRCTDNGNLWGFITLDAGDVWLASTHRDYIQTAAFIVGARSWLPALLAEAHRLRMEIDRINGQLARTENECDLLRRECSLGRTEVAAAWQQLRQQLHDEQEE